MACGWTLLILFSLVSHTGSLNPSLITIKKLLLSFNSEYIFYNWVRQSLDWDFSTNITKENAKDKEDFQPVLNQWMRKWKYWARSINAEIIPQNIARQVKMISEGILFTNETLIRQASKLQSKMLKVYSLAEVPIQDSTFQGEDQVNQLMATLRNPDLLRKVWEKWGYSVGRRIKPLFLRLVDNLNNEAIENGYNNVGQIWRAKLSMQDPLVTALELWEEVSDFYYQLHFFVRSRLVSFYGQQYFKDGSAIPVYLLGSIWGENWESLEPIVRPFPETSLPNITEGLERINASTLDLFKISERIYTSLGLYPMLDNFWNKSMFVKPNDSRLVDCHASSYDFSIGDDYRVKMCAEVSEDYLRRAIHEMGHIQYFIAYRKLPMLFRSGANSAFHEAVGETMVYSTYSTTCLNKLSLIKRTSLSKEEDMNLLMKQALSKIPLLPWALVVDLWRYEVFEGTVNNKNMTSRWWELRKLFQGVIPSNLKESLKYFDPGTKYHIAMNMPYLRYYFGRFLEVQFYESLCYMDGYSSSDHLHRCCFLNSKAAGHRLKLMMSLGASRSWKDALELLTGKRFISSAPLLRYYRPLYLWLKKTNAQLQNAV